MAAILVPTVTISEQHLLQRTRELPVQGEILVAVGATVTPDTVVGSAELPGDLEIVRVAERFGVHPLEAHETLLVKVGESVSEGSLLARHSALFGLLRSELCSPVSGTIEFISERTCHIGIRLAPRKITLTAFITGVVAAIIPGKSVVIEGSGAYLQGIFGIGGERTGTLHRLSLAADARITVESIPQNCAGLVLWGGSSPTLEALQAADTRGASGLICGSIDADVLRGYLGYDIGVAVTGDEKIGAAVICTEGFGEIALSPRVVSILKNSSGKQVSLNGATQVRAGAVRPELFIAKPESAHTRQSQGAAPSEGLVVGTRIRVIRFPFFGRTGAVTELPSELVALPTGAQARVLRVALEGPNGSTEVVTVPRANVELL